MAGRPKKNIVIKTEPIKVTENEIKKTKKEIELEKKLAELEERINNLVNQPKLNAPIIPAYEIPKREQAPYREFIEIVSLTNHILTLSTETQGGGVPYNFIRFGEMQTIIYDDLAKIINNNRRFTVEGAYKILDERVVRLHGLTADYQKILDKDVIENILTFDKNQIESIFKSTTKRIQDTIISILTNRLMNGEELDLNKLEVISKLHGKDLNALVKGIKDKSEEES